MPPKHFIDHERETRAKFVVDSDIIVDDITDVMDNFIDYTNDFFQYLMDRDIHIRVTSVTGNRVNDTTYWEPGIWIDGNQILGIGNNYSTVVVNPTDKSIVFAGSYNISADSSEADHLMNDITPLQGNGYIFVFNSYGQPADGSDVLKNFFADQFGAYKYGNKPIPNRTAWCMIHAEGRGNIAEKKSAVKNSTATIDTIIRFD